MIGYIFIYVDPVGFYKSDYNVVDNNIEIRRLEVFSRDLYYDKDRAGFIQYLITQRSTQIYLSHHCLN